MSDLLNNIGNSVLEFVDHHEAGSEWIFSFGGAICLNVGAPWRLVVDGEIRLGCEDHAQLFGLATPVDAHQRLEKFVIGKRVESASTNSRGDLTISFSGEVVLEIFNSSCGYEGWALSGPGNKWVVAQGGGRVVES